MLMPFVPSDFISFFSESVKQCDLPLSEIIAEKSEPFQAPFPVLVNLENTDAFMSRSLSLTVATEFFSI